MSKVMVRYLTKGYPQAFSAQRKDWIHEQRPDWDVGFHFDAYSVAIGRNGIFKEAARAQVDYLIMVDDDVIPNKGILDLPERDKPVIGGPVPTWSMGQFFWNTFHKDNDRRLFHSIVDWANMEPRPVTAIGAAILCIRGDVLQDERMRPPFTFKTDDWGTIIPGGGEDIQFCFKAIENGHEVWADPQCQGGHYRPYEILQTIIELDKWRSNPDFTIPAEFAIGLDCIPYEVPELGKTVKYPDAISVANRLDGIVSNLRVSNGNTDSFHL